jgi:hypothetical protein
MHVVRLFMFIDNRIDNDVEMYLVHCIYSFGAVRIMRTETIHKYRAGDTKT